ncbi:two-component system, sensor histidine kinase YesM [Paenibacillus sp. UNCCL117]|uniref:sensor histidine kinase n=1 Tax=unclassified Paenibacillus TaxID=185978 RepID=UPI000887CF50|nr:MULTISPECIES: sensor histidine kinase [unclassified Paenibacillus]SDC48601.1 two-component system, sensor histidine kinase YesM [Paenibacillus sp. cl123]SFW11908.1 two-component system, sensor histidine kinase YesM [Paenibacillus sp. UNCCL117]
MKHVPRNHSIQTKLTMTFLLILLPLVTVSVFANYYSQNILNEQISDRTKGALLTTLEYVDQLTKSMDQQTLLIASNPNIVDIWSDVDDPLRPDLLYGIHTVQQQLSALTNVNGAVKEAFILHGESGNGVSTLQGGVKWPGVKEEFWFQQTMHARGGLVTYVPTKADGFRSDYLSEDKIYYVRLLDVLSQNKEPNVMILAVDKLSFRSIIQHLQTSDHTDITLFYNDEPVLETNPLPAGDRNQPMFHIKVESDFWSIELEQPMAEVFQLSRNLQRFTFIIIAVSIVMAVWIAWFVYSRIAKPLRQLVVAFKQFSSGNLTTQVEHQRRDEFGFVMNAFNRMAVAQRKMIEDDYEKELRLAKAEFSLLQSQINPHFLYNTLDAIYSVALKKQVPEISDMVINLARFFRVSLGKGRESFTLSETVQHLMYYIRVQQLRKDNFSVHIELDEATKRLPMLKLILQPLVENAIIHGLEKSRGENKLYIRSKLSEDGDRLSVEVSDTGAGIPEDRLAEIRKVLSAINSQSYQMPRELPFRRFYGLQNVKSRLKLYYGEEADFLLDSSEGQGTKATIIIPIQKGEKA